MYCFVADLRNQIDDANGLVATQQGHHRVQSHQGVATIQMFAPKIGSTFLFCNVHATQLEQEDKEIFAAHMTDSTNNNTSTTSTSIVSQNLVKGGKVSAKVLGEFILIKQKLGEGSFAEVFKGYRKSDKLPVAIKVINKSRVDNNAKLKSSLEFEISVLRRKEIDHSHIIQLYAVHVWKKLL